MGGLASHILRVASLGRTRPQGGEFSPWGPSGSNVGSALRPGYGRPLRKPQAKSCATIKTARLQASHGL